MSTPAVEYNAKVIDEFRAKIANVVDNPVVTLPLGQWTPIDTFTRWATAR